MMLWWLWGLVSCATDPTFVVEGVVVEVHPGEVVIDHQPIAGFLDAMTNPFELADAGLVEGVRPGHRVIGRIRVAGDRTTLEKLRVVGQGPAPEPTGPLPLALGDVLPATEVVFEDGGRGSVGAGQGVVTGLTFVYTRCPDQQRCPATTARLQALQTEVPEVRWVAVTLDPEHDTVEVLGAWTRASGADPTRWRTARLEPEATVDLARRAGLPVARGADGSLVHEIRWLVLDPEGRLIARYESNDWTPSELRSALVAR